MVLFQVTYGLTKMPKNMLSYCKIILEKMSFDPVLLNKEYHKCLSYLSYHEAEVFKQWVCKQPFYRWLKKPSVTPIEK